VNVVHSTGALVARQVSLPDGPLSTIDVGDGPALLFLHGWQMSGRAWTHQLEFADTNRVIVPDLPGFGRSHTFPLPRTIAGYADVIADLLDALEAPTVTVVGNSMGGMVATELALRSPDRVERLVLVAAAGVATRYSVLSKAFGRTPLGLLGARTLFGNARIHRSLLQAAGPLVLKASVAHPERLPQLLRRQIVADLGCVGAYAAAVACLRRDHRAELADIDCPSLVIWGRRDGLVSLRDAFIYAERIRGARLHVYPDAGHCPQLENPGLFNRDLAEFLGTRSENAA
jgi:pimeloyl-ACP methyl ester carboxylesterase